MNGCKRPIKKRKENEGRDAGPIISREVYVAVKRTYPRGVEKSYRRRSEDFYMEVESCQCSVAAGAGHFPEERAIGDGYVARETLLYEKFVVPVFPRDDFSDMLVRFRIVLL